MILLAGITLLGWCISLVVSYNISAFFLFVPLFFAMAGIIHGSAWIFIEEHAPRQITLFYLLSKVLRMILAIMLVLVYLVFVQNNRQDTYVFVLSLFAFYIVMLVFDSIYFAKVEILNKK